MKVQPSSRNAESPTHRPQLTQAVCSHHSNPLISPQSSASPTLISPPQTRIPQSPTLQACDCVDCEPATTRVQGSRRSRRDARTAWLGDAARSSAKRRLWRRGADTDARRAHRRPARCGSRRLTASALSGATRDSGRAAHGAGANNRRMELERWVA